MKNILTSSKTAILLGCVISLSLGTPTAAAERFDFTKHCDTVEMTQILQKLLPRGTDKSIVVNKLVKEGGATSQAGRGGPGLVYYDPPAACGSAHSLIVVTYDSHDRTRQITVGGKPLFQRIPPGDREDRTDAWTFNFLDYDSGDDLLRTLQMLFPAGTPRNRVEEVLIKWNNASPLPDTDYRDTVRYLKSTAHSVDSDGRPLRRRIWDVSVIYRFDQTLEDLWVTDDRCSGGRPPKPTELGPEVWTGNAADVMRQLVRENRPADISKCWADSRPSTPVGK